MWLRWSSMCSNGVIRRRRIVDHARARGRLSGRPFCIEGRNNGALGVFERRRANDPGGKFPQGRSRPRRATQDRRVCRRSALNYPAQARQSAPRGVFARGSLFLLRSLRPAIVRGCPDDDKLTPANPRDVAFALSIALTRGPALAKAQSAEVMSKIVADRLVAELESSGSVVMQKPPAGDSSPLHVPEGWPHPTGSGIATAVGRSYM